VIVCKQCGHHNEDNDTFCGSCGKFLEWSGERVAVAEPEPPPPPAPEPEPEPARVGLFDRVKQAVGIDETAPAPAAEPAPPPPASAAPVASAPVAASATPAPAPVQAAPVRPGAGAAPAPALEPVLAGVAAPAAPAAATQSEEPGSRRPTSVAPTGARQRPVRRPMEPPTHRRQPGDLICGQCGEGNDPTRHFCRRCGNSLDEAIAVRLPWYRRFFNRLFGVRTREAGWRPRRVGPPNVLGGVMRIVRIALGVMILLAVLGIAAIPSFRTFVVDKVTGGVTRVVHIVRPSYDPVYATGAKASTNTAGHLPTFAIDKFNNTYWAAVANDRSPTLTLTFSEPQDLAQIGFDSGASGAAPADAFLAQPRPHTVHLVFSNGTATDLTLKDQDATKPQFYAVDAKQIKSVEIHVTSVYAPAGASSASVAITEVEFRVKN
jgi:zinc ribbon protein